MPSKSAANGGGAHDPYIISSPESMMYQQVVYEPGTHDNPAFQHDPRLDFYPYDNAEARQFRQERPAVVTRQPNTRRLLCLIIASVVVVIVIIVAIVLIVTLTAEADTVSDSGSTTPPPRNISGTAALKGSFRLKSETYVIAMGDVNSDVFKTTARKYETVINRIYQASKQSAVVKGSVVTELRQGSVVVVFELYLGDAYTTVPLQAFTAAFEEGVSYLLANAPDLYEVLADVSLSSLQMEWKVATSPPPPTPPVTTTTTTSPSSTTTSSGKQYPDLASSCGVAGRESGLRIVGGRAVRTGRYPWVVLLRSGEGPLCGGSIIDSRHVLSAAHCLTTFPFPGFGDEMNVMAGEVNLNKSASSATGQIVPVARIYTHRHYNQRRPGTFDTFLNDIAVLRLSKPLTFNSYVSPVCLPQPTDTTPQHCTVAGWGTTSSQKKDFNTDLLAVTLSVYDHQRCRQSFGDSFNVVSNGDNITNYLSPGVVCTGNLTYGGQDACFGDSGGPLFCASEGTGQGTRYTQFGLVSWGDGCGQSGTPGFYAYLPYFRHWLHRVAYPVLEYLMTIQSNKGCVNVDKCGHFLKNATHITDTQLQCQRFADIVNCSMHESLPVECNRENVVTTARQYAQFLNLELEGSPLNLTSCPPPPPLRRQLHSDFGEFLFLFYYMFVSTLWLLLFCM